MGGVFNLVNLHVYHYAGNNPVKYIDPNGMWTDNEDGTFTAEQGDTLWDLYGADWQEKSGYTGDPAKLQIGEVVGHKREIHDNWESYSGPSQTPQASDPFFFSPGFGVKAAIVLGIGAEIGVDLDTSGGFGIHGTFSLGTGVELGLPGKGGSLLKSIFDIVSSPGAGWARGSVEGGISSSTTIDAGAVLMGTYDMNNLGTTGLPSGIGLGVGGGVWKNWKFTWKIK
jgi:hypothetical protein